MKMCAINTFLLQGKGSASGHNVTETQDKLFPSHFTNDGTRQGNSVEKLKTELKSQKSLANYVYFLFCHNYRGADRESRRKSIHQLI